MKKNSTMAKNRNEIFKQPKLTIGLDLGDRWSFYCVLDEAGRSELVESYSWSLLLVRRLKPARCSE